MKKLPIEWTEDVEEKTGLTLESFLQGHLENLAEIALDVATIQSSCTNYKDKIK